MAKVERQNVHTLGSTALLSVAVTAAVVTATLPMPPVTGHRLLELERVFDEGYRRIMADPASSQSLTTEEMEELVQLQEQHGHQATQMDAPSAKNTSNRVAMLLVIDSRACYSCYASLRTVTGCPTLLSPRLR
jgi:hypothetical protein